MPWPLFHVVLHICTCHAVAAAGGGVVAAMTPTPVDEILPLDPFDAAVAAMARASEASTPVPSAGAGRSKSRQKELVAEVHSLCLCRSAYCCAVLESLGCRRCNLVPVGHWAPPSLVALGRTPSPHPQQAIPRHQDPCHQTRAQTLAQQVILSPSLCVSAHAVCTLSASPQVVV